MKMRKIHEEMKRLILRHADSISEDENLPVMIDGLTNPEHYESAKMKIMYVFKEAYSTEDDSTDVIDHTKYLDDDDVYILDPSTYPAHWVVSKISSGILRNWLYRNPLYDKFWNENDIEIMKDFKSIAWVNVGKFSAPGGSRTSASRLSRIYQQWKDVLYRQIDAYDPDIIIFGGSFGPIEGDEDCEYVRGLNYLFREGVLRAFNDSDNRLVIATYHPSQYTISREKYVNAIIHSVRRADFKNKSID